MQQTGGRLAADEIAGGTADLFSSCGHTVGLHDGGGGGRVAGHANEGGIELPRVATGDNGCIAVRIHGHEDKAHARSIGCSRVWWLTHESNTDAMLLYDRIAERSGFLQYRKLL